MNVLVITDLSEAGLASLEGVFACGAAAFEHLTLLHVIDLDLYTAGGSVPELTEWALTELDREARRLRDAGFDADARVEVGPVVGSVHKVADEVEADLLVATNLGRGAATGRLLGSTAERLAPVTHRPLLLERVGREDGRWCRLGATSPFGRVLLGVDLESGSAALIQKCAVLPGVERVRVLHAVQDDEDVADAQDRLRVDVEAIPARDVVETAVVVGRPADTLIAQAREWDASVVAVGSCRHGLLHRGALGSVARRVALHADRAVLLLPPG